MLVPLFISFAMMSFSSYAEEQANKPIGQMSFKWRKNYVEATTTGASISDNQNTDNTISETTEPATTDNQQQSTAFGTTDNNNTTNNDADKKNPYFNGIPIMDCLHKKCHDLFMDCFNDDTCKDFMKEWQKKQSLSSDCLPADKNNNNDSNDKDINVVETTNVPNNESSEDVNQSQVCKYSDEFWHMYECGVRKYCYNDQRDLIKAHNLIISPSYHRSAMNHHLDPTNTNSYTKWTLVLVASLSAFLVVILYTLIQRLRKDCDRSTQYSTVNTKNVETDNETEIEREVDDHNKAKNENNNKDNDNDNNDQNNDENKTDDNINHDHDNDNDNDDELGVDFNKEESLELKPSTKRPMREIDVEIK